MKRFLAIIFIILLSMQVQGQEMTRLAYTSEARIPSMQAWELLRRAQDWVSVAREPLNFLIVSTHSIEHELDCEVWFQDYQPSPQIPHSYDILFHIYITCFDGRYVVNLTDIVARVDGKSLSDYEYMTEDSSGIRGGLFGFYWRRHDRQVRIMLEEYFQTVYDSLFEVLQI
jgi:hypothetical protein